MGCLGNDVVGPITLEQELEIQQKNLMVEIEENNFKVSTYEIEIERFNK